MYRLFTYPERTVPAAIMAVSIAVLLFAGAGISKAASLNAQDPIWRIKNTSGDFSIDKPGAHTPANRINGQALEPGDTIRTGVDGRLLLSQGADSLLLEANTAIVIPHSSKNGSAPAMMQLTGSVEYLLVTPTPKQFSVETPFLAVTADRASFRIVVRQRDAHVEALVGDVEVLSRRSGQVAHLKAGQAADDGAHPKQGLILSGKGKFAPISQSVRGRWPVMPAAAAMNDKGRSLLETPEGQKPITAMAGQEDTRQKVDLLAELSRSDLTSLAATVVLTSKVLPLGSARRFPNPPADDLMTHSIELKDYTAMPSLASMIRSARDTEKPGGAPTIIHATAAHFDPGATRTAIANLEPNASNPRSFDSRGTKAALAKFLTTPGQDDQPDQPTNSINNSDRRETRNGDQPKLDSGDPLLSWGVPLGIGALVTFMTLVFRPNQKKYDKGFDYQY
jgi:FecR protein